MISTVRTPTKPCLMSDSESTPQKDEPDKPSGEQSDEKPDSHSGDLWGPDNYDQYMRDQKP
jgi:hypothetical protein